MYKILIASDDISLQLYLSNIIKSAEYEVITTDDGRKALEKIWMQSPHVVLLDIRLPGINGMKVLEEIKKRDKNLPVIILTANGQIKEAVRAIKSGASNYITKPFDNKEILSGIKNALKIKNLNREAVNLNISPEDKPYLTQFIGESPQIKDVMKNIKVVAPTNMTVTIQGETGTGKELIAQVIHQESPRHNKPFIAIDCGALPENLLESELFGYEKGAFTGADTRKEGKIELTNSGTLFLDEITNLPISLQAKLLRVIQERRICHLGGTKEIKIDVRIIDATNTIMSNEIKKGRFRNDLYYRLNEFNINLPPLRERKADIPILARYFLEEANLEFDKKIEGIASDVMESLLNYHWPGNVREIRNEIRKAAILTDSSHIREINLPAVVSPEPEEFEPLELFDRGIPLWEITGEAIKKIEKKIIKKALIQAKNNKVKAARVLKIDRMTLYSKIKSLGL